VRREQRLKAASGRAGAGGVAGPSTAPFARCASGFAQDDRVVLMLKKTLQVSPLRIA
jgi:hypothetical protein